MSPLPSREAITESTLLLFLALCDPFREEIPGDISQQSWIHISQLSKLHGVTPFLYYRARSLGLKLPEQIEKEWLGIYLYQIAEEQKARRQIKELKEVLNSEQIPMILLKGASAMMRLYPEPGLRTFCDLDILIPIDKVSQFKQAMTMAGYKPLAARNSPEDEELKKFDGHLDPFQKEERLMIEPHLSILGVGGVHLVAMPEIWQEKEEINTDGILVDHLSKEQFIIYTLLHCKKHISVDGFVQIKTFIDLLYGIRTWKIDWSKIRDIVQKWDVEKNILSITATLNQYWQANIPLREKADPLEQNILVLGVKDRQKQYYAKIPRLYIMRLFRTRDLPDTASRVRYLSHLFFPTRENLRWRYNLSSKKPIAPYYFVHLLVTCKKFLTGLWHQLLFHTQ